LSFLINPYSFASGDTWEETFDFGSSFPTAVSNGDTGTYSSTIGSVYVLNNEMTYAGVDQPCASYSSQLFTAGALSDTMWTMLANETIWTKVDAVPAPCFYGASNANNNLKDSNDLNYLGGLLAGCGPSAFGDHATTKYGTTSLVYSTCWAGNGSGSDNWTTLFRESATTSRFKNYPTSARSSDDYNYTLTVDSGMTGLDRLLCCGQNAGPSGRKSDATIDQLVFKNGVNSE
tara:strand:+ start:13 stop:708 length:696 start_codon:yes stop_codon:yes gene_type:complete